MASAVSNLAQGLAAQKNASVSPSAPDKYSTGATMNADSFLLSPPDSLAPQQGNEPVPHQTQLGYPSVKLYGAVDPKKHRSGSFASPKASRRGSDFASSYTDGRPAPVVAGTSAADIARFFLPALLLGKGEKKTGQLMKELCVQAPEYAALDAPRRRRLMDGALAHQFGGGADGDVIFTKTAWGTWMASVRGQEPVGQMTRIDEAAMSPPDSAVGSFNSAAIKIPTRCKAPRRVSHAGSLTAESSFSARSGRFDHHYGHDSDADAMSMDEDDSPMFYLGSRAVGQHYLPDDIDASDTDEEDWQSMGAAGLSARSQGTVGGGILPQYVINRRQSRPHGGPASRSMPSKGPLSQRYGQQHEFPTLDFTGTNFDASERAATEALLRMSTS